MVVAILIFTQALFGRERGEHKVIDRLLEAGKHGSRNWIEEYDIVPISSEERNAAVRQTGSGKLHCWFMGCAFCIECAGSQWLRRRPDFLASMNALEIESASNPLDIDYDWQRAMIAFLLDGTEPEHPEQRS
jgi:hypothetical protein